jgi:hypothetical protein
METISFNKKALWEFIHSEAYQNLENLPISYHRAVSHFHNPRADDADILLVATFDGNKTVGYLGVLPDYVFLNNDKQKIGWFSCFWVDEEYKSKNVAASLFLRIIKAWNKKIMITNIVPSLIPTYQKTKIFQPTVYKTGLRCYYKFNFSELLPPKKAIFGQIKPLLKISDWVLNSLVTPFSYFRKTKVDTNVHFLEISKADEQIGKFLIDKFNISNRKKEDLDWALAYPWVIQKEEDSKSKQYYFSSISAVFYYKLFKVLDEDQSFVGFFLLKIRDGSLTIPYFHVEPSYKTQTIQFIFNWLKNNQIDIITIFLPELVEAFEIAKLPFILQKPIKKAYIFSKDLPHISDLDFQDGDGDCIFY